MFSLIFRRIPVLLGLSLLLSGCALQDYPAGYYQEQAYPAYGYYQPPVYGPYIYRRPFFHHRPFVGPRPFQRQPFARPWVAPRWPMRPLMRRRLRPIGPGPGRPISLGQMPHLFQR